MFLIIFCNFCGFISISYTILNTLLAVFVYIYSTDIFGGAQNANDVCPTQIDNVHRKNKMALVNRK